MTGRKVGEYFLDKGLILESDIALALSFQKTHPTYLGEILFKLGKIPETELLQYLSKQFNVQYITSEKLEKMAVMNPSDTIPLRMAMDKTIFPLKYSVNNYRLTLLTYEPQNIVLFDELKILLNGVQTIVPVVAPSNVIKALILKQYNNDLSAFDRLVRNTVQVNHLAYFGEQASVFVNQLCHLCQTDGGEVAGSHAHELPPLGWHGQEIEFGLHYGELALE